MNKFLSTILTGLLIALFTAGFVTPTFADEANDGAQTANAEACETDENGKSMVSGKVEDLKNLNPDQKKEYIVVPITESLSSKGGNCLKIIQCLNTAFGGNDGKVLGELTEKYQHCVVVGRTGADIIGSYSATIYKWMAGIVGAICVLIIVVSGIQISMSGISADDVSSAKDRITRALIGLAILFLSGFILATINPIFFT
jgi:hypothetical protein